MKKDSKQYRILIIEDNPGDFVIVSDLLSDQISIPAISHATTYGQAFDILAAGSIFDIILLDLSLPDKKGQELVTAILQIATVCPVIILTGYADIDFSIKSVSEGISDYLLKDELNAAMLYKSIIYAIERTKTVAELISSERRYSDLFDLSPQPMWVFDSETFKFTQVNKATIALYGYSEEEFLNITLMDIKMEEDIPKAILGLRSKNAQKGVYKDLTKHRKKGGEIIEVEISSTPITINGRRFRSVVAIDVTEKNQYENKITRAIIKTQEDERYEIGGELHDNVCQLLAVSQLTFGMVKESIPPIRSVLFKKGMEYIAMALEEIRNLSHRLAPAFFDETTLEEAFTKLFETVNADGKLEIVLHFDALVTKYPLGLELQLNLYRILQEQLRNIQKYANASLVEVDLIIYDNKLKMRISDDGIGFNMGLVKQGIGLSNMKRRAELFSGKFGINSSPGEGCTVEIGIPLHETRAADKEDVRDIPMPSLVPTVS